MKTLPRLMLYGFLALFLMGTIAHAANATAMSLQMALADGSGMDMGECDDCDGSKAVKSSCDLVCAAPLLANISADTGVQHTLGSLPVTFNVASLSSRTGPPELSPPRYLILI